MTYEEAVAAIENLRASGIKPGLERMERIMALYGNPHWQLKVIHVAGTNGKGSTGAMIRSILTAAGYRTGWYSSPAVMGPREMISVDGVPISKEDFAALADGLISSQQQMGAVGTLSEFELTTALAMVYFARQKVDFSVVECGMGGRDDATNLFPAPKAVVLTPVAIDHAAVLGRTVEEIARNKCGILRPGSVAISAPGQPEEALAVLYEEAARQGISVHVPCAGAAAGREESLEGTDFTFEGQRLRVPLIGSHQVDNALTAMEAVRACVPNLTWEVVERGLAEVRIPCRQEWIERNPPVLLDGAHNPHGAAALADTLRRLLPNRRPILIAALLADKDATGWVAALAPLCAAAVCCEAAGPRPSLPAQELRDCLEQAGCPRVSAVSTPEDALRLAQELAAGQPEAVLVAAGSFYLCADLCPLLASRSRI
ncbi:MAG: bifunctional folylpolyglutamate synthase/dihydrofolate synthase [Clostridiales bacterium]|nr:bifunctional folylpolyglutamate synthase/dihydrofolate synthase [Clostridiales bacterium]